MSALDNPSPPDCGRLLWTAPYQYAIDSITMPIMLIIVIIFW